jgi:ribosomal protein L16 Arg81 hydroxylase
MIVSDAPNCGITYGRHYDNHNSFIIQATGHLQMTKNLVPEVYFLHLGKI